MKKNNITITVTGETEMVLEDLQLKTKLSRSEVIRQSVALYALLSHHVREGATIIVNNHGNLRKVEGIYF